MPITIHPGHAYAFITGLVLGKFTNLVSDLVITGLVLYIVTPEIFTEDRISRTKNWFWSWFQSKPVKVEMVNLSNLDLNSLTEEQKIHLKLFEQEKIKELVNNSSRFNFSALPKIEVIPSPSINSTHDKTITY
jgi:hypothetical protein